jgi:hypothetical protein
VGSGHNFPRLTEGGATFEDLETLAREKGVALGYVDIPSFGIFIPPVGNDLRWPLPKAARHIPVILLSKKASRKKLTWILAHELGHFSLGHRVGLKPHFILEIEAWNWARQVLRNGLGQEVNIA